MILDHPNPKV